MAMDIYVVRNVNTRSLANSFGTISAFSKHVGINPHRMSALLSTSGSSRNIGSKTARQIENKCSKPHGWIDINHTDLSKYDISNEEIAMQFIALSRQLSNMMNNYALGKMSRRKQSESIQKLISVIQSINESEE